MTWNYEGFMQSFEDCNIDASSFSHVDHIGVAHEMLRRYDFLEASARYSRCISTIAAKAGATRKFNTTITIAFLSLIAERMNGAHYASFDDFIGHNEDLVQGNVLARWYSPERLKSDLARTVFLMPDQAA